MMRILNFAANLALLPQSGQSFIRAAPSMASTTTFSPRGLDRTDDRPAPFVTASASGSTIESALGSLGSLVRGRMGAHAGNRDESLCKIGVLFYNGDVTPGGGAGVQGALAGFHGCVPFIDQILASPTRATSTSQHCEEAGQAPPEGFTVTLTLINNPGVTVDTFVLSPSPDQGIPPSLREERIESHLARALKRPTANTERGITTGQTPQEPDQFDAVCLAFGADSGAGAGGLDCDDVDAPISQLHKLNGLLRGCDRGVNRSVWHHSGVSRCPLVGSVTCASGGVFVSRRDEDSGECSAVSGGLVGAILGGGSDSSTSFQLVHAGKHAALRGSQFRIAHMKGGNIAEVVPVQPIEATSSAAIISPTNDGYHWPRPHCIGAALSAAEWCKHTVSSATLFEKMAMQSALGIGLLERKSAVDEEICPDSEPAPLGVMPCLPAQSCFDVREVEADGSLRLSEEAQLGQLRAGDLCDFRAVGALASLQAEQDAYAWLHASRISAAMRWRGNSGEQPGATSRAPVIQGCLVASARARFPGGFEEDGCQAVVMAASGPGGLPTVGIVPDAQLVSVDNTMLTCYSNAGFAGVYVCGSAVGQEKEWE